MDRCPSLFQHYCGFIFCIFCHFGEIFGGEMRGKSMVLVISLLKQQVTTLSCVVFFSHSPLFNCCLHSS